MTRLRPTPVAALVAGLFAAPALWAQDVLVAAAPPTPVVPAPVAAPLGGSVTTAAVLVNGREVGQTQLLDRFGLLFVPVKQLKVWGIAQRPEVVGLDDAGQTWYPLTAIRGAESRWMIRERRLELTVPQAQMLAQPAAQPAAVQVAPGVQQIQPASVLPASNAKDRATGNKLVPMEVVVNGRNTGSWLLLDQQTSLYAPEEAFRQWRLENVTNTPVVEYKGQRWRALSSVPGFEVKVNASTQSVDLTFSADVFPTTRISEAAPPPLPVTPAIPMAFVNYDLNYVTQSSKTTGTSVNSHELGAALELGVSGNLGVLTSSYVGRGLNSSDPANPSTWRRLETTFTKDLPAHNLTLRLGDTTTRYSLMGTSLYFGGVQIGTNYGLRPGYVTYPVPIIAGSSAVPSTVDLYINDALRKTSSVPSGPFTLEDLNAITGTGEARVVVKDILGRETVITQSFFTDIRLLKQGLNEWSFEAGKLRRNLGTLNADYGPGITSGVYRYGLTNETTLEGHAQVTRDVKNVGVGVVQALPAQLLGRFGVTGSHSEGTANGHHYLMGVEHHGRRHGFTALLQGYSQDFRRVGYETTTGQTVRTQLSTSYNYHMGEGRSVGLGYANSRYYDSGTLNTYSANYSMRVATRGSLLFNLTHVTGASRGTSAGVSLIIPLDGGLISQSSVTHQTGGSTAAYTSISKPITEELGVGWRALVGTQGGNVWGEAGVQYQGSYALLTADAAASNQTQAVRLGARGGMAIADGRLLLSRRIENALAFVEVPGFSGVGISTNGGGNLTRTDGSGIALLPRLMPYRSNPVHLNANDLPISAEIDNTEMAVVPADRTAVKVSFPVRSGRSALVRLVLDDGQPVPAGTALELVGDKKPFFVARKGEAYVTGMQASNLLKITLHGKTCTVKVDLPPENPDDIPRLGPLTCSGVKR